MEPSIWHLGITDRTFWELDIIHQSSVGEKQRVTSVVGDGSGQCTWPSCGKSCKINIDIWWSAWSFNTLLKGPRSDLPQVVRWHMPTILSHIIWSLSLCFYLSNPSSFFISSRTPALLRSYFWLCSQWSLLFDSVDYIGCWGLTQVSHVLSGSQVWGLK